MPEKQNPERRVEWNDPAEEADTDATEEQIEDDRLNKHD